jgi:superfamily I DNA/RNA helicase/Txe/YoeB family toxin of Txe-Axe toxin-antitoxin module
LATFSFQSGNEVLTNRLATGDRLRYQGGKLVNATTIDTPSYQVALSHQFYKELNYLRRATPLRNRIDRFLNEIARPFSIGRNPEKLVGAAFDKRYSIRLSDGYRAIFDLIDNIVIYRALANHDPSYRKAARLGPPVLSRVRSFRDLGPVKAAFPSTFDPLEEKEDEVAQQVSPDSLLPDFDDVQRSLPESTEEPDGGDQFVLFNNWNDLEGALSGTLSEWMLFLPDAHRRLVTQRYNGPARIFGPSGTGKTCILLHRAVYLARSKGEPVLVLTFNKTLAKVLASLKGTLCGDDWDADGLITISTLHQYALELSGCRVKVDGCRQAGLITDSLRIVGDPPPGLAAKVQQRRTLAEFVRNEVLDWIKGTAYGDLDIYQTLDFPRGRPQLSPNEREWIFRIFERYQQLKGEECDWQDALLFAERKLQADAQLPKWGAVLVDEFQDLSLSGLSLVRRIAARNPAQLFFAGDHRQRIYRTLPSFKDAGIPIVGRSFQLAQNYRNTPEIYEAAQSICRGGGDDPDEKKNAALPALFSRTRAQVPTLRGFKVQSAEDEWVGAEVRLLLSNGCDAGDIAILSLTREKSEAIAHRLPIESTDISGPQSRATAYFERRRLKRATIHGAKGLEFPIVFLVGMSLNEFRMHPWVSSEDDPASAIASLVYIAMTRARDRLYVSFSGPPLRALCSADWNCFQMDDDTRAMLAQRQGRTPLVSPTAM